MRVRQRKGVLALRAAHEQLELVLAAMDFALDGFSEEFVPTSLVGTPESAGVHRAASRGPVFNCLSVSTLGACVALTHPPHTPTATCAQRAEGAGLLRWGAEALACEMVQMFRAEVEVKVRVSPCSASRLSSVSLAAARSIPRVAFSQLIQCTADSIVSRPLRCHANPARVAPLSLSRVCLSRGLLQRRVVAEAARLLLEDEADDARDHTELRARLEVCLATWMLEPEIDTRRYNRPQIRQGEAMPERKREIVGGAVSRQRVASQSTGGPSQRGVLTRYCRY